MAARKSWDSNSMIKAISDARDKASKAFSQPRIH